jgi:GntR family transcriptional regulator
MTVPLYQHVYDTIIARIVSGELAPGAMLPSEIDLGRELNVSQGTARKALSALEQRGILQRRQGRGTFVAITTPESAHFHFFRLRRADGSEATPSLESESITRRKAKAEEKAAFGEQEVFEIVRGRSIDGKTMVREVLSLPTVLFPGLSDRKPLPNSLYALYQQSYGIVIAEADERLNAVLASEEDAAIMNVEVGSPLIEVRRLATDISGRVVELRLSRYLTSELHYAVTLR